jgi:hypothetical protein
MQWQAIEVNAERRGVCLVMLGREINRAWPLYFPAFVGPNGRVLAFYAPVYVAVPLRDAKGNVVAALNVTMPMGHESSEDAVRRVLGVLRETAQVMRPLM